MQCAVYYSRRETTISTEPLLDGSVEIVKVCITCDAICYIFVVWNVVSQCFCADRLALHYVTSLLPEYIWMDIDMVNFVQY